MNKIKALFLSMCLLSLHAYAAVPAEVKTQMNSVKADITTIGGMIIALAAVAMGIRWVKAQFF